MKFYTAAVLGLFAMACASTATNRVEGDFTGECDNGADEDRDGLFDCQDPDCAPSPTCADALDTDDASAGTDTDRSADDTDTGGVGPGGNHRPHADAGPDQARNIYPGDLVSLDGTGSSDPDGDLLTYQWTIVSRPPGSVSSLSNSDQVRSFLYVDEAGDYVVQLRVSDGLRSHTDAVLVTANAIP